MNLFYFILPFLQIDVNGVTEKLKNAPKDSNYETGLIIGSFIPFALLAVIIIFIFVRANRKKKNEIK